MINLEKLLELLSQDNVRVEYSNIDGKESLIVNGENLLNQTFDDSQTKEKIKLHKERVKSLPDYIFELVMNEVERRNYNLSNMNALLECDKYDEATAENAEYVIMDMDNLINNVITAEVQKLMKLISED